MSFANFDFESQRPISKRSSTEESIDPVANELDIIIDKTSDQLQSFGHLVSQFDNQRKQLGTKRDCQQFRENIDGSVETIGEMNKAISGLILELSSLINQASHRGDTHDEAVASIYVSKRQLVIKERLVSEFSELESQFKKSVRLYNEKRRTTPVRTEVEVNETTPLIQQEQQQQQQQEQIQEETIGETELQYHLLLTQERNREIEQVHEGIQEVNTIFKDLHQLVSQQGEQLNTIEDNVLQLHGNTQQAERELNKAHEYQKQKGKWSCILLIALVIVVLIIVLAVVS
ncbi:Syntaxin-7 [Spathaspora sp. JA1]|nr:Syntaxin-7 [Spathaspora sp. JA1]